MGSNAVTRDVHNQAGEWGAGGDPYAACLKANPYNDLPDVNPDDGMAKIREVQFALQRRGITAREDAALRALRDLRNRLTWDLLTLGTTPGVPASHWETTRARLLEQKRSEAAQAWQREFTESEESADGLHVRGILAANEVARWTVTGGRAPDAALAAFVGRWAALLQHSDWLLSFVEARCACWKGSGGGYAELDVADQIQVSTRVEATLVRILQDGAADDTSAERWRALWQRERSAIEAVARACGRASPPPGLSRVLGPLGLQEVQRTQRAQDWVARAASREHSVLALAELQSGRARFGAEDTKQQATAASGVQKLFSGLGLVSSCVWRGEGRRAVAELHQWKHVATGSVPADPWFGQASVAIGLATTAALEVEAEALVHRLREELGRSTASFQEVIQTFRATLSAADAMGGCAELIAAAAAQVSGRVLACTEGRAPPGELERVLRIAELVLEQLGERGAVEGVSQDIAKLLLHRAQQIWNRNSSALPSARVRAAVLRDLLRAAELAPRNAHVVEGLASVAYQVRSFMPSLAEQQSLARRALDLVEACLQAGGWSGELEQWQSKLRETADPDATFAQAWSDIERIIADPGERGPSSELGNGDLDADEEDRKSGLERPGGETHRRGTS
jgi:hypothetical protein